MQALAILNDKGSGVDLEQMRKSFPSFIYSQNSDNIVQESAFPSSISGEKYSKTERKAIPTPIDPKMPKKDIKPSLNGNLGGSIDKTFDSEIKTNTSNNGTNKKKVPPKQPAKKANPKNRKTKFSRKSLDEDDFDDEEDFDDDDYDEDDYEDEDYGKKKRPAVKGKIISQVFSLSNQHYLSRQDGKKGKTRHRAPENHS